MTTVHEHLNEVGKAAASGFIGSALEYYDFFIYAQAAALIFPQIFFDKSDPKMAIIGALGTYAVGYVARPIGAFVLGSWGDKYGRKNVLVLCMLVMGSSTFLVSLLPTYSQVGFLAPSLLMALRLIQGFAVAGEISGASSMILEHAPFGRRGFFGSFTLQGTQFGQILAAAIFIPLSHFLPDAAFQSWGWRIPFALSAIVVFAGYLIRRRVSETPAFEQESEGARVPHAPIVEAFRTNPRQLLLVACIALINVIAVTTTIFGATYATNKSYGIHWHADVYLWIPLVGNIVAVLLIPFVGNLADKIGRRPPIIVGCVTAGLLSYAYLWAISQKNLPLAVTFSLVMWGVVYQGQNAVYPAFYPEQFPTKTRVTSMAIAQNAGVLVSSLLPAFVFTPLAPPGSHHVVLVVGSITFGLSLVAALAAFLLKETYRIPGDQLGDPDAQPLSVEEYRRLRAESLDQARAAKAAKGTRVAA
jgi:MFS family permease